MGLTACRGIAGGLYAGGIVWCRHVVIAATSLALTLSLRGS